MKKYIFFAFTFLLTLLANGTTYYVVPNGAGNKDGSSWANAYVDVQTAIDKASSAGRGEVWIAKGTYKHGSALVMKNNVAIYGGFAGTETTKEERVAGNNTIFDGEEKYGVFYNSNIDNSAKLDNVTIQNGYAVYGAGMGNVYASPEITNCTFSNNRAIDGGGGMHNCVNSSPVLTNCTFSNNSARGGSGISNSNSSPVLTNCTFANNDGCGMYNYCSSSPKLTNCILWGNTASSRGNEIYNDDLNNKPTIDTCIIEGGYSSYGTYTNIITADPKLMPLGNYGGSVQTYPVRAGSSAIGVGKVVEGVTKDARGFTRSTTPTIGACEFINKLTVVSITTIEGHLKYSSSYEFTLNANVPDASNLTYQWYKDGVAIARSTSSSYKMKQDVGTSKYCVVVSDETTLITSSEIVIETTNATRFYVSTEGSSKNDGLSWATAKNSLKEVLDYIGSIYKHEQCAIEVWIAKGTYKHGSSMTMKNGVAIYGGFAGTETSKDQRITGNNTILDGEGEYRVFDNDYTEENPLTNSAKLDNVTIQNGRANSGAGMDNCYASPEITNCTFSNNSATSDNSFGGYGGGMYNYDSSPVLTNCTFSNNTARAGGLYGGDGGGMYNQNSSSPVLTNCTFSNNNASSDGGGMYNDTGVGYFSSLVLTNCTFFNNSASSYGGGMFNCANSSPVLTNCTFSNNSASNGGGGMYNHDFSTPVLTNCILWGNTASSNGNEIYNYDSAAEPTIDTCIIKGGKNGIYNSSYCKFTTEPITADPKLIPLGNYGGSVRTCPVCVESSAMGAGKVIEDVTTDARGVVRSTTKPTIGAYEYLYGKPAY